MFQWFNDTLINTNADKCHLFVSTNNTAKINIGNFDILVIFPLHGCVVFMLTIAK